MARTPCRYCSDRARRANFSARAAALCWIMSSAQVAMAMLAAAVNAAIETASSKVACCLSAAVTAMATPGRFSAAIIAATIAMRRSCPGKARVTIMGGGNDRARSFAASIMSVSLARCSASFLCHSPTNSSNPSGISRRSAWLLVASSIAQPSTVSMPAVARNAQKLAPLCIFSTSTLSRVNVSNARANLPSALLALIVSV